MKECYIVGGGSSLIGFPWRLLKNKFVIAINCAYGVLPDADIVYFTDQSFWKDHEEELSKHTGRLIRGRLYTDPPIPSAEEYIFKGRTGFSDTWGEWYHMSNSGAVAIQLAYQLGFKRIYLLGYDMKFGTISDGESRTYGHSHWHGCYKNPPSKVLYKQSFLPLYPELSERLAQRDVEVININTPQQTDLRCFPIRSKEEIFG